MTFDGGVGGGDNDDSDRFRWWLLCLYFFCCGCIFLAFDCSGFVPFDICGYNFFFYRFDCGEGDCFDCGWKERGKESGVKIDRERESW